MATTDPAVQHGTMMIPLSRLRLSPHNPRSEGGNPGPVETPGVEALAASIEHHGLLQPLLVYQTNGGGEFLVAAGGRRMRALWRLVEDEKRSRDMEVPCVVITEAEAAAAGLAENVMREALSPADEYRAYAHMLEAGESIEDIAAGFGVSDRQVRRRLRLAAAAPELLELLAEGDITLAQLEALCVKPDPARQLEVWNSRREWDRAPVLLRRAMLADDVVEAANDPRVAFIGGVEVYRAAGGTVKEDLFADDDGGVLLTDVELLASLVRGRLNDLADEAQAEGWAWVEVWPEWHWERFHELGRVQPQAGEPDAEQQAEIDALVKEERELQSRYDQLEADIDNAGDGVDVQPLIDEQNQVSERLEQIEERLADIDDALATFTDEQRAVAGVVIGLRNGEPCVERGLVRPEDRASAKKAADVVGGSSRSRTTAAAAEKDPHALPEKVRESLLGWRNAAAQVQLAQHTRIAKALLVCWLIEDLEHGRVGRVPLDLQLREAYPADGGGRGLRRLGVDGEPGIDPPELEALLKPLLKGLPLKSEEPAKLWRAVMKLPDERLDALVAFAVARALSLGPEHDLWEACVLDELKFDMEDHFVADRGNFYDHVPKAIILDAFKEAGSPVPPASVKKAALAERAAEELYWCPPLIRTPGRPLAPAKGGKKRGGAS